MRKPLRLVVPFVIAALLCSCTGEPPTQGASTPDSFPVTIDPQASGVTPTVAESAFPAPKLPVGELASPVFEIGPAGRLPSPVTVTFNLAAQIPTDSVAVVATREANGQEWTYAPGTVDEDRHQVSVQADHFSFFAVALVALGELRDIFKSEFAEALTGGLIQNINKPSCDNEGVARKEGYSITSTKTDVVYWCLGVEDGERILKVVGHRRYPLLIEHPGLAVLRKGRLWEQWGELATLSRSVSGNRSVLFSGEELVYSLRLQPGGSAGIGTEFDGIGNWLSAIQAAATGLLAVFGLFESNVPAWMKSQDAWFRLAKGALTTKECAATSGKLKAGEILTKCMLPIAKAGYFGSWVAILGPMISAAGLVAWTQGQLNALVDVVEQKDKYLIVIRRAISGSPFTPFMKGWYRHGGSLGIQKDGTGVESYRTYDEPPDSGYMYYEHDTLRFAVASGGRALVGTVTAVDYDNGEDRQVNPPEGHANVGDVRTYILKDNGALAFHEGRSTTASPDDYAYCWGTISDGGCGA